jgi:hypothetical protein
LVILPLLKPAKEKRGAESSGRHALGYVLTQASRYCNSLALTRIKQVLPRLGPGTAFGMHSEVEGPDPAPFACGRWRHKTYRLRQVPGVSTLALAAAHGSGTAEMGELVFGIGRQIASRSPPCTDRIRDGAAVGGRSARTINQTLTPVLTLFRIKRVPESQCNKLKLF